MPTIAKFFHEFVQKSLGVESQLGQTLKALLLQPGLLTVDYLAGRRQRYMSPVRLYLSVSLLFFVLLSLVPGIRIDIGQGGVDVLTEAKSESRIEAHTGFAFIDDRVTRFSALPMDQQYRVLRDGMVHNAPKAMFLLVPLFAGLLALLYRRHRYGEHLLSALHFHSFVFLLLPIGLVPWPQPAHDWINDALNAAIAVYLFLMLRRIYGGSFGATAARLVAIVTIYVVAIVAAVLAGVVLTLSA